MIMVPNVTVQKYTGLKQLKKKSNFNFTGYK